MLRGGSSQSKLLGHVEELAHVAEFLVAVFQKLFRGVIGEDQELALEDFAENLRGALVIGMRAAIGFRNNFIDDAELLLRTLKPRPKRMCRPKALPH